MAEARQRFTAARVAVLATVDRGGRPHLVPVTFAVSGDLVVTAVDRKPKRTPHMKRLTNIAANPSVCLLVEHWDEDWQLLWWVRADGEARLLPDPAAAGHCAAAGLLTAKYAQYADLPPDGTVIQVAVRRWLGWSARPGPGGRPQRFR
ncbi:TIGR03668 family PPOX class F420-dependent oxidoreductase [Kitasatospora sp. NPDC036755]|uniref:TIGR03668 family PPOX class F420-dependent oxidoreductase n=1 Tax=Kitasatospora sp. NPDC036755 TaxID=3154600 RepID=UPI0033E72DCF